MRADTSFFGLFQFSVEKVYKVRYLTPILPQTLVISLTELIPSLWPAMRDNFLELAHLPLPSIIIAMWFGMSANQQRIKFYL